MASTEKRRLAYVLTVTIALCLVVFFFRGPFKKTFFEPPGSNLAGGKSAENVEAQKIEVIAENLQIPWAIVQLPGGDYLITERPGSIKRIGKNQQVYKVAGVAHRGEGGLLGLSLHPNFKQNNHIYLYLTTNTAAGLSNRIEQF